MEPVKTHLPYDKQLARMAKRGLSYQDYTQGLDALKRIGYYRLSAYTYPFRAAGEDGARSHAFEPDSTLEDALKLYAFDEKLRSVLLEGLNLIEVGLAVKVAYTLGKRHPEAHLDSQHLDLEACSALALGPLGEEGYTQHSAWVIRYDKLKQDAIQEEYVKHHVLRYGGRIPIWVATEFLDFGCLIRLHTLLKPADTLKISAELGLSNDRANTLHRWAKALNILRNHCAHSNRIWNRSTVDVPPKFSTAIVDERIHHLNDLDASARLKLYYLASLIAYLVTEIDPSTNWPRSFKTVAKKLGAVHGMTVNNAMGFPEGWETMPLWNYDPAARMA